MRGSLSAQGVLRPLLLGEGGPAKPGPGVEGTPESEG